MNTVVQLAKVWGFVATNEYTEKVKNLHNETAEKAACKEQQGKSVTILAILE